MFQFVLDGGIMMYPLLVASVLTLAIIIDRFLYFKKAEVDEEALITGVKDKLRSHGPEAAVAFCDKVSGPIAAILKAGLEKFGENKKVVEESFEREALIEVPRLKKHLPVLNTIAGVATLIGFTGTVFGMIRAFRSIAEAGTTSPAIVAGGIAEALTTTATGLIIAIPALIFYYYFSHRAERILLEVEKASYNLIEEMEKEKKVKNV
ncbi:MAG: MotA/TolQ/ExbB proton channel family protein [Elusimicrobiota bacterium]